jgi:MFS transporter, putative metabolite:H+ symporter
MRTGVNAGERLDRLPASGFHKRLAALIGAGMFFDGFDLFLASNVLGALTSSGFSNLQLNGRFITATFLGMMIGSFLTGWVGDRFGRRVTYQINLAIFGLASVAAALAPNMAFLIGARFVIGIGLGAEIVVGYATYTEFLPPAVRGKWLCLLGLPMQFALFFGSFVGLLIIPGFGWRPMFWIAAIGAGVVWYLRKNIPESPRWLEQQGRYAEAEAVLQSIERQCGAPIGGADPAATATTTRRPAPTSIRSKNFRVRFFVGSVTVTVINVVSFGLLQFVPTFFVNSGMSITRSFGFATIMALGGPVGGLIAFAFADRLGRKSVLVASALMTAFFSCFYPFVGNGYLITLVGFLLVTALYVNSTTNMAMYVPELFPTDVRLRSVGTCHTVGRIAGALMPFAVVSLYTDFGITGVVAMMVSFLIFQAVVVWTLGIEPRFQSLEVLDQTNDDAAILRAVPVQRPTQ